MSRTIVFTPGSYLIEPSGKDDKIGSYGILIDGMDRLELKAEKGVRLFNAISKSEEGLVSFFYIKNSSNLRLTGFVFENLFGSEYMKSRKLYNGAAYNLKDSRYIRMDNNRFVNTYYGVCSFKSSDLTIENNLFINKSYTHKINRPQSAILLYSTKNSQVLNNQIYGALGDGDLSIFGTGSDNSLIQGNFLYGYEYGDPQKKVDVLAQGITLDQGPKNNIIKGNYVFGYFYGIDIKAETYDNKIVGNTVEHSKVGIMERRGEAPHVYFSSNNEVADNLIIINNDSLCNTYKFWGKFEQIGLAAENRSNLNWHENKIIMEFGKLNGFRLGMGIYDKKTKGRTQADELLIASNSIISTSALQGGSYLFYIDGDEKSPFLLSKNSFFSQADRFKVEDYKKLYQLNGRLISMDAKANRLNNYLINFTTKK
ncbi:NosD domain-containing protein [Leeuwenhoekiella sp. W20_SRS_FM14]|uniref:NosD domain-containing protein n=1 Tax=Leeuwenhoekiella sp. W20_SRS_FM14 TaxID=3240270 RepID=UPI003F9E12D1